MTRAHAGGAARAGRALRGCGPRAVTVHGVNGAFPVKKAELFLGNAGTAVRPLTAVLALCGGEYRIDGVARMHERPIGDLVDACGNSVLRSTIRATRVSRRWRYIPAR